jgi:hypothetical protein
MRKKDQTKHAVLRRSGGGGGVGVSSFQIFLNLVFVDFIFKKRNLKLYSLELRSLSSIVIINNL